MTTATPSTEVESNKSSQISRSQARFAFIVLLVINILNYVDRSVLAAVQTSIQKDFHLTNIELGLLTSSFLFIYGISTLPIGIWADRGVRKNIVTICVGIWSLATAIGGFTQNFFQLFLTRSVLGIGEAGYAPASVSLIGDYFSKEQRGQMLSIWSVGNLIGTAIGLIAGGLIAQAFGWRWVFYVVGVPGLLAAFFIWRTVEPKRGAFDRTRQTDENEDVPVAHASIGKDLKGTIKKLLNNPTYWVLTAAFICSFFIVGASIAWVPTYLQRDFHLSISQAASLSGGVFAGGSLTGTLLGGWLADFLQKRRPEGRMIVTTLAFLIGAPLILLALTIHSLPYFIVAFVPAIIALSLCLGPIQAIIQDITTPDIRSTAVGLALLLGHLLGDASSPIIIGALSDRFSLNFALLITAPTCLLLAGLICLLGLKTVRRDMEMMQLQLRQQGK
ncbi:MAG: MFS transporter [Ktedonobacteraceae bacterium]